MRRRGFLVGSATAIATALAGCSAEQVPDDLREAGGGGGDGNGSGSGGSTNRVEDGIYTAIGEVNLVAAAIQASLEDAEDPTGIELDVAAQEERVEGARAALDEAEDREGADEMAAELDAARSYVEAVAGLLDAALTLVDAADVLADLETALAEADYERASELLDTAVPPAEEAYSAAAEARSQVESYDAELLESYGARTEDLRDGLGTLADLSGAAEAVVNGYGDVLDGRANLQDGRDAFEAGDYGAAASEFEAGEERFVAATSTFEAARAETDTEFDGELETAVCRSTNLEVAADHFAAAAEAADAGDAGAARDRYDDGETALDRAASC